MSKGYEAKVTVVRMCAVDEAVWYTDDGTRPSVERAYLIRGLPMPGEKVDAWGRTETVTGIAPRIITNGGRPHEEHWRPGDLTPRDPEAEKLDRVTVAIRKRIDDGSALREPFPSATDLARAAIVAMEATDD